MKFSLLCRVILLTIITELYLTEAKDSGEKIARKEDINKAEEVDFGIPDQDPRSPFHRGRPPNVFGTYGQPTRSVEEFNATGHFPSPQEFYERFIKQYKPVVMKEAAKHSAAFLLWTEDYLRQEYGELTVRLEARSEDSPKIPNGVGGMGRDTIANFLDRYQSLDGYIISQIPSPMEKDISFPPFLTCGSLAQAVQEVHLFLSARGGKTLLHRDPYSSVHCVFNGTKQWLIAEPTQKDKLYMSEDSRYEFGGYSDINVDDVDYVRHPNVRNLDLARVILKKGDCIYMPSGYTHQVRSQGYMNSAVSIWFSHYMDFDPEGCQDRGSTFTPMSEASVLWRYSGYGDLSQGHMDVHMLRMTMKTTADKSGKVWLEEYASNFIQGELNDEDILINQRLEFVKVLDVDGTGYVTVEALDALPLDTLKELIEILDPSDVSNREDYEYNHISRESIWGAISMLRGTQPSQPITCSDFIKIYTIYLGGTEKVAREILAVLDPNGTDQITGRMVIENGDRAFARFDTGFRHDPTIEHLWYRQFVAADLFRKYGGMHADDPFREMPTAGRDAQPEDSEECRQGVGAREDGIVFVDDLDSNDALKQKEADHLGKGKGTRAQSGQSKGTEDKPESDQHDEL